MTRDSHKWQNATVAKPKRKYATRKAAGDLRRDIEKGIEYFWRTRPRAFQSSLRLNGQKLK